MNLRRATIAFFCMSLLALIPSRVRLGADDALASASIASWRLKAGDRWDARLEYVRFYRLESESTDLRSPEAFRDGFAATAHVTVASVDEKGIATVHLRFEPVRLTMGMMYATEAYRFDTTKPSEPIDWMEALAKETFELNVDPRGRILDAPGWSTFVQLLSVRYAWIGETLFHTPVAAGESWSLPMLHDMRDPPDRFLDQASIQAAPLGAPEAAGDGTFSAKVPEGSRTDLGVSWVEGFVRGATLSGGWSGKCRDGLWTESTWEVEARGDTTLQGRPVRLTLVTRYRAVVETP